jgi:DNA-binding NarL/FixJ family response regulator
MAHEPLTHTEKQVLLLRAAGLTIEEIADRLNRSYHTIDGHCKEIHRKSCASCGMMALGVALARNEISLQDLIFLYTSLGLL